MDKYTLSERDICTKFITPALHRAGWDVMSQIREEVSFTKGRNRSEDPSPEKKSAQACSLRAMN
jgi:type I site-specific restriction endonuclease